MQSELNRNTPIFDDTTNETEIYRCGWCCDDFKEVLHFDHTINGNICLDCLNGEDHQFILGMNEKEYKSYKSKVLKSNPIAL